MKFSIQDFSSKCDQIRRKLWILSHLLDKSLIENLIFCPVGAKQEEVVISSIQRRHASFFTSFIKKFSFCMAQKNIHTPWGTYIYDSPGRSFENSELKVTFKV